MDLLDTLVELRNRLSGDDAEAVQAAMMEIRSLRVSYREAKMRLEPAIAAGMQPGGVKAAVTGALRAMSAIQ